MEDGVRAGGLLVLLSINWFVVIIIKNIAV